MDQAVQEDLEAVDLDLLVVLVARQDLVAHQVEEAHHQTDSAHPDQEVAMEALDPVVLHHLDGVIPTLAHEDPHLAWAPLQE